MKNNIELIPTSIFEWSMKISFSDLSKSQQEEVLLFINKEEYNELYQSSITTINTFTLDQPNKTRIKNELAARYDKLYQPKMAIKTESTNLFWKVAATLLLFGTMGLTFMLLKKTDQLKHSNNIASTDTVYMQANMPTYRIIDTVYMEVEKKPSSQNQKSNQMEPSTNKGMDYMQPSDLYIGGIKDLENEANQLKHQSLNDDSLINKFQFVTL